MIGYELARESQELPGFGQVGIRSLSQAHRPGSDLKRQFRVHLLRKRARSIVDT
jgi:hypothetical protein